MRLFRAAREGAPREEVGFWEDVRAHVPPGKALAGERSSARHDAALIASR